MLEQYSQQKVTHGSSDQNKPDHSTVRHGQDFPCRFALGNGPEENLRVCQHLCLVLDPFSCVPEQMCGSVGTVLLICPRVEGA